MKSPVIPLLMDRARNALQDLALSDPTWVATNDPDAHDRDGRAKRLLSEAIAEADPSAQARVHEEYFGTGPLAPLLERDDITEIIVNGAESVWYESGGRLERHDDCFHSHLTYRNFIQRICRDVGSEPSLDTPFIDGSWNGFRVHLIIPPVSLRGSVLTLRRHPKNPWTLAALESAGWADASDLSQIRRLIKERANILIVGGTGTGKTSALNACLQDVAAHDRTVIIEDTSELHEPNQASTKLLTRRDSMRLLRDIEQNELVRQALRMRPDRIVMGEIRGSEAKDLLMAFATGHTGCMGTLHADSARQALLRLEMLIQLGAPQWNLHAVRTLILLSLQAVVVVKRDGDGRRHLGGIYRLASLEETGFLLERLC